MFGPTPPISHFRVKPLGFTYGNNGVLYGLIQINYHTLWNRDDGLVSGGLCIGNPFINPAQLFSHNLDNEYSALLVAAPVSNSSYNPNLQDYSAYAGYTAAHENTFFDHSHYINISTPYSFGNHLNLWLSLSKHATYTFNPNYYPLTPQYIIFSTYDSLYLLYYYGEINIYEYLAYLFIADETFYACIVEQFNEQGGMYAETRINIGELNYPLNGSHFIQDVQSSNQLSHLFY